MALLKPDTPQRPRSTAVAVTRVAALLMGALCALPAAASEPPLAKEHHSHGYAMGFHVSSSGEPDLQYSLLAAGGMTTSAVWDNGAWRSIGKLQKEVDATGHELLWFALEDKAYVLRDAKLVERAHDILEPINELGSKQGKLGSQQGDLGRQQGELGRLQGRIGELQGRFARLQATSSSQSRDELDDLRTQLEGLREDSRALTERQRELGAKQRELGARQRELGEQQRIAFKQATSELRALVQDAVKAGKAELLTD